MRWQFAQRTSHFSISAKRRCRATFGSWLTLNILSPRIWLKSNAAGCSAYPHIAHPFSIFMRFIRSRRDCWYARVVTDLLGEFRLHFTLQYVCHGLAGTNEDEQVLQRIVTDASLHPLLAGAAQPAPAFAPPYATARRRRTGASASSVSASAASGSTEDALSALSGAQSTMSNTGV